MRILSIIVSIIVIGVILLMFVNSTWAASIDNIIQPLGHGKLQVTAADTFVFDRDIDAPSTEFDEYNQAYTKIAYGLGNYINVYTKLGTANMKIKGITDANETTVEKYKYSFLWGGGISAGYEIKEGWILGVDAQYNAWKSDLDSITVAGEAGTNLKGDLDISEWQGAIYLAKIIPSLESPEIILLPYIGAKYAQIEADYAGISFDTSSTSYVGSGKAKNDNKFGFVAGINIDLTKNLKINVEGLFIDETGVTAGLSYKF